MSSKDSSLIFFSVIVVGFIVILNKLDRIGKDKKLSEEKAKKDSQTSANQTKELIAMNKGEGNSEIVVTSQKIFN